MLMHLSFTLDDDVAQAAVICGCLQQPNTQPVLLWQLTLQACCWYLPFQIHMSRL